MAKYILVGADPKSASTHHGGVLTLSIGLIDHVRKQGHDIEVINTLRSGFDAPPIRVRLQAGLDRAFKLFWVLKAGGCHGVIIFSGAGYSFYERIVLSAVCRWFAVKDLFVIVDGWFFHMCKANILKWYWIGLLLRVPCKLAASGSRWSDLFTDFGIGPSRIVTIHYWLLESFGVSEREKTIPPGSSVRFVFIGWMIKEKGIYELLAAIEELRKNYHFSFTFIGGGTLLEAVRRKIRDSGWADDVSALGWVSNNEMEKILSCSDLLVLPSYAEGFPMSLIEAFSKGMPAICTDVGGVSDTLKDGVNGYLIPPRQVRPLIEAMECYLRNPQIITEHSRAALEIVKSNHNAKTNCELILNALR